MIIQVSFIRPYQRCRFDLLLGVVGKIDRFQIIFLGGAEVANSYKHVFGRDGINYQEEIQHLSAIGSQKKCVQNL